MKHKLYKGLLWITVVCMLLALSGCGGTRYEELMQRNYYREYFHEEFTRNDDEIEFGRNCKEIVLSVSVTNGSIKIIIVDEGKAEQKKYEYRVDESLNMTFPLTAKTRKDRWVCVSEFDENTEANITIGARY